MLYDFKCKNCGHEQQEVFSVSDYDKRVMDNGRLKRKKCKECKTISLYRHIITAPGVLGGSGGYVSMERWQREHPDNTKRKEESLQKKMEDRHRKRVLNKINKQMGGGKRKDRNKDYGEGQGEDHLRSI
jgi:predicted nucleic acid-binding Zn ribbon protein